MTKKIEIESADQQADEKSLASERQGPPRVGFGRLDELPLITIPEKVRRNGIETLIQTATSAYYEGGRGPTVRRLLARELSISLAAYRYRQALAHILIEHVLGGYCDPKRLEAAERLVAGEHRRLMAAIDRLAKLDANVAPQVRVTAHGPAQVNIGAAP